MESWRHILLAGSALKSIMSKYADFLSTWGFGTKDIAKSGFRIYFCIIIEPIWLIGKNIWASVFNLFLASDWINEHSGVSYSIVGRVIEIYNCCNFMPIILFVKIKSIKFRNWISSWFVRPCWVNVSQPLSTTGKLIIFNSFRKFSFMEIYLEIRKKLKPAWGTIIDWCGF